MNLEELADNELGPGTSEGRAEFLDSCREIGRSLRIEETAASSIVGSLYWLVVARQLLEQRHVLWDDFPRLVAVREPWKRRASRAFGTDGQLESLVVAHGDPVRFSLVLLDPEFESRQPLTQEIPPDVAAAMVENEFFGTRSYFQRYPLIAELIFESLYEYERPPRSPGSARLDSLVGMYESALLAYARMQAGGVIVVRRPRLMLTSGSASAAAVCTGDGATSTAGMLFEAPRSLLITAANHAVTDDAVEVAGVPAEVIGRHQGTDSCVLRVPYTLDCPLVERARQLHHHQVQVLPPRPHEEATFVGATSGPVETKVRAYDPSILFRTPMPDIGSRLYTDCDTNEGDSGAALYDSGGNVIGFAAYRTAYGEDPSYSVWIWAKQVVKQHKLDRL